MRTITVVCRCGARLSAPVWAAGKQAPCPHCGTVNRVPGGQATAVAPGSPAPMPAPVTSDAATAPTAAPQPQQMPPGVEDPALSAADEIPWEQEIDLGPLPRGILQRGAIYCIVATTIVALGWYMAAATTQRALVPGSLAVGLAAGLAMMIGARRKHISCGLTAMGIAAAAILLANLLIFHEVVLPVLEKKAVPLPNQAMVNTVLNQAQRIQTMEPPKMPGMDEQSLAQMDPQEAAALREVDARRQEAFDMARQSARDTAQAVKDMSQQQAARMRTDLSFASHMADCLNIVVSVLALGIALLLPAAGLR